MSALAVEEVVNNDHLNGTIIPFEKPKKKLSPLSEKQKAFIKWSNFPINIAHGGVRGGKNFAIDIRLVRYFLEEPVGDPSALFGFIGATKATVKRNILSDFQKVVGEANFKYNSQSGEGEVFNRAFQVFDYKDSKSVEKLRGSTLGGAVITECSFCPEDIFDEVNRRLTDDDAKLFIDTNPDNPHHWLFKKYIIDSEKLWKTLGTWHFTYKDNLSIGPGYEQKLLSLFRPGSLKYQRFVQGLWVAGEGIIFDNFDPVVHVINHDDVPKGDVKAFLLPIDPGTVNAFAALLIFVIGDKYFIADEFYYDSQAKGKQKTESEYCIDIAKFMKNTFKPNLILDPSRASFKAELNKNLRKQLNRFEIETNGFIIRNGFNDVLKGIDICNALFNQNKIYISKKCVNLLQQISNYTWDLKALARGVEQPLKVMDHTCDAFRYGVATYFKNLSGLINSSNIAANEEIDYSNF